MASTEKPCTIKTNSTELENIDFPASTQPPEHSDSLIDYFHLKLQAIFKEAANSSSGKVK